MDLPPDALRAYLFDVAWQSTAWLAAGLVASALLRRRPARAHGVLLLSVGGAVATPPLAVLVRALGWGLLGPAHLPVAARVAVPAELVPGVAQAGWAFPWDGAAAAAWVVLSLIAIGRLAASLGRGILLASAARPLRGAGFERLAADVARRLGLPRPPVLCGCESVTCPLIWCWGRRPRVLLPAAMVEVRQPRGLFGVLCHELAHLRRGDHLASLAAELAVCALPWHPLAWWVRRRIEQLAEHAADEWTLASGESPTAYAEVLVALAGRAQPAAMPALRRHGLRVRIRRILQQRRTDPDAGARWMTACGLLVVALVAGAAAAQRRAAEAAPVPPPAAGSHEDTGARAVLQEIAPHLDAVGAAQVLVVPGELDLGHGEPFLPRTGSVWLINTAPEPRHVLDASANCDCTQVVGFESGLLAPGEMMKIDLSMTAPVAPGMRKTKLVTFKIEGQAEYSLPIHLAADGRGT
jgi:Zn-dependent protease with chaperone function